MQTTLSTLSTVSSALRVLRVLRVETRDCSLYCRVAAVASQHGSNARGCGAHRVRDDGHVPVRHHGRDAWQGAGRIYPARHRARTHCPADPYCRGTSVIVLYVLAFETRLRTRMIPRPPTTTADASSPSQNVFRDPGPGGDRISLILAWSWIEQVSVATYVLASLAFSAAIVTLLIVVIFATLPIQYFRHRRAFRDEVRRRGELSEEEREEAIQLRRLAPQSFAYRDPRVIPWWEW